MIMILNARGEVLTRHDARDQYSWLPFEQARATGEMPETLDAARQLAPTGTMVAQLLGQNLFFYDLATSPRPVLRVPVYQIAGEKPLAVEVLERLVTCPEKLAKMLLSGHFVRRSMDLQPA